jgi:general secretion pathway protein K
VHKPRAPRTQAAAQRGAALLLAMVILILVTTITAGMVWQQTRAVQVEAAERARAQAAWILSGALDWARLILREDLRTNQQRASPYDSLDEVWATPLAEARLSSFLAADKNNNADTGPEAFISGAITDAQARFNLRGLVDPAGAVVPAQVAALQRLAALAGAGSDTGARIAAAIAKTMVPAGQEGGAGSAGAPMRPARVSDLVWLGIDEATLARLASWVDLLPEATPINANTAAREVLVAAIDGLDEGSAERLVQARKRRAFEKLDDLKAQLPPNLVVDPARVSVGSSYFEVAGLLRLEDRVLEERSLLARRNGRVEVLRRERRSFGASERAAQRL